MGDRKPLRFARKPLVGLDVDSSSVRMVHLRRRNGQYTVVGAAVSDIASRGDDRDQHNAATVQAIRQCMETTASGGKLAVCGLRGPEVVVRAFEFPTLAPEETEGAVRLEASQICPFSMDEGEFDHQVTSDEDNKTRGFWVAAARGAIEGRQQLVRDAGLQCVLMDVTGLALLNCLESTSGPIQTETTGNSGTPSAGATSALLDIGDSCATIAITDHAHRPFVRDVSYAGHEIMRHLAREMKKPMDQVRAALFGDSSPEEPAFQRSLEAACKPLLEDIVTTLRYFAAQNRSVRVEPILVCGRFALAKGLVEALRAKLPVDVTLWNPVSHMSCEADSSCEATLHAAGPALAVAAGFAMRTV